MQQEDRENDNALHGGAVLPGVGFDHLSLTYQARSPLLPKWIASSLALAHSDPIATAYRYHAAWGSHCSPQRQSSSLPVTAKPRSKSMSSASFKPPVMPLMMPPGALVYSYD